MWAEVLAEGGQEMIDEVNAYVEANPDIIAMSAPATITESNLYQQNNE